MIAASPAKTIGVLKDAGASLVRMFERENATAPADSVDAVVLELASTEDAKDVLAFSADHNRRPCPDTCVRGDEE
jgi:hypothetical protein